MVAHEDLHAASISEASSYHQDVIDNPLYESTGVVVLGVCEVASNDHSTDLLMF